MGERGVKVEERRGLPLNTAVQGLTVYSTSLGDDVVMTVVISRIVVSGEEEFDECDGLWYT